MSIGGEASEQNRFSESWRNAFNFSQGSGESFIDPNQQGFLDFIRGAAQNTFNAAQPGASDLVDRVNAMGNEAVANLSGLGNTQQVINSQLEGLRSGLGELQQQGLNQIGDNAANSGAFGGARHGIAESALRGEIGDAFTRGYGDIIANASRQSIDANNAALAGGGQMITNNLAGTYGPLQALAGIIGDPTILQRNDSISYGEDDAYSYDRGNSESAGFDFGFK